MSEEEEEPKRRHIRHVKKSEIMLQECERYVHERKRLPKLHSRWLLNEYINAGSSLHGLETAHNYTRSLLDEARQRIKQLEQQLAECENEIIPE